MTRSLSELLSSSTNVLVDSSRPTQRSDDAIKVAHMMEQPTEDAVLVVLHAFLMGSPDGAPRDRRAARRRAPGARCGMIGDVPPPGLVNGRPPLLTSFMRRRARMRERVNFLRSLSGLTQGMIDEHNHLADLLIGRSSA